MKVNRKMIRFGRSGFTLVELLIVTSIITVMGYVPFILAQRLDESRVMLEDRAEVDRMLNEAMRRWRDDISSATEARVLENGTRMEIAIYMEGDAPTSIIVYEVSDAGMLTRRTASGDKPAATLARDIGGYGFEAVGRGFGARWEVVITDGVRTWRRLKSGYATPLSSDFAREGAN